MSVPTDTYYTQRTVLGLNTYVLTFRYNARMDRWILDIADANNVPILQGLPILTSAPVFGLFVNKVSGALPNGSLLAIDMTGQGRDPQLNTFLGDVMLGFSPVTVSL